MHFVPHSAQGIAPTGGLKIAFTLFFKSLLSLGNSLPSVGKPCKGTRAGVGALQEGPNFTGKHCMNSDPDTVGCLLSRGGLRLVFQLDASGPLKSCLGFVSPELDPVLNSQTLWH